MRVVVLKHPPTADFCVLVRRRLQWVPILWAKSSRTFLRTTPVTLRYSLCLKTESERARARARGREGGRGGERENCAHAFVCVRVRVCAPSTLSRGSSRSNDLSKGLGVIGFRVVAQAATFQTLLYNIHVSPYMSPYMSPYRVVAQAATFQTLLSLLSLL